MEHYMLQIKCTYDTASTLYECIITLWQINLEISHGRHGYQFVSGNELPANPLYDFYWREYPFPRQWMYKTMDFYHLVSSMNLVGKSSKQRLYLWKTNITIWKITVSNS